VIATARLIGLNKIVAHTRVRHWLPSEMTCPMVYSLSCGTLWGSFLTVDAPREACTIAGRQTELLAVYGLSVQGTVDTVLHVKGGVGNS
jgi:hypothetical protein